MKNLFKVFAFTLLCGCCQKQSIALTDFVSLIPQWEVPSNSSPYIVGDNGAAYGHYQIHEVMVDDYNRITGSKASHRDAFDPETSERMARAVLSHYAQYIHSTGIPPTVDHMLFIWNGGGGAWRRVERPLADQKQTNLNRYRAKALPVIFRSVSQTQLALRGG